MQPLNISSRLRNDFPPDARYQIGVSGGRDSVALLHWLTSLGYKKLIVCHLNHELRGRSSDADARFVQKLVTTSNEKIVGQALRLSGQQNGKRSACPTTKMSHVNFELGRANVRSLAKKKNASIESAAREARYSFFAKAAK